MLTHFNLNLETLFKSSIFNYVVAAILSQKHYNGILKPMAFMSKKMSSAERIYEVYDKKLLAII